MSANNQQDNPEKSALIIVDMSIEQVANLSYRKQSTIDTILHLIQHQKDKYNFDLIVDSHLWIDATKEETSLTSLYPDIGRMDHCCAKLIPEINQALYSTAPNTNRDNVKFVRKYNYSSFAKPSKLDELLRSQSITNVYLTGINTDYCIFATALDAFYLQYNVHIIEEGVSSVGGSSGHHQGLEQIAKFGCARVVSVKDI